MECFQVQENLSAYFDGELPHDSQKEVAQHLESCAECAGLLNGIRDLAGLAQELPNPQQPNAPWSEIDRLVIAQRNAEPSEKSRARGRDIMTRALLGIAAIILVALGWWVGQTADHHHDDAEFTETFGQFLTKFSIEPDVAQSVLLGKYKSREVRPTDAIRLVGYIPAIATGVPPGYTCQDTYVIQMPCCTCVESICNGQDGNRIALFEHDDDNTAIWFGERLEVAASFAGVRCRVVDLGECIAASWRHNERYLTLIGVRDNQELERFVAWYGDSK